MGEQNIFALLPDNAYFWRLLFLKGQEYSVYVVTLIIKVCI